MYEYGAAFSPRFSRFGGGPCITAIARWCSWARAPQRHGTKNPKGLAKAATNIPSIAATNHRLASFCPTPAPIACFLVFLAPASEQIPRIYRTAIDKSKIAVMSHSIDIYAVFKCRCAGGPSPVGRRYVPPGCSARLR